MLKTVAVLAAGVAMFALGQARAGSPIQNLEFLFEESGFNYCAGEDIKLVYLVNARFREAETPSGIVHIVDKWSYEGTGVGQSSGIIWNVSGTSPFTVRLKQGQPTGHLGTTAFLEPISEGPRIRINQQSKITVNAIGEVVVETNRYVDNPERWCKVLPAKQ